MGSIGEILDVRILMFKYMVKFENIGQSIYYLWFYYINPILLIVLVLFTENNKGQTESLSV
jgi:hypothetical protein